MKLALNTLVYEVGNKGPEESLRSAAKYGFKYIEYAGIRKGNPQTMSATQKKEAIGDLLIERALALDEDVDAGVEHEVDAGLLDHAGGREVVGGDHHDRLAVRQLRDRLGRNSFGRSNPESEREAEPFLESIDAILIEG